MTSDLILGAIDGYDFHEIAPFLITLRQSGYRGHLTLFAGPGISSRTKRKMRALEAEVIEFGNRFPFVEAPHQDNVGSLPEPIHICNFRYYLYYDYLLKQGAGFRNVLITDVRDVVFQRDPFQTSLGEAIHVAMENVAIPIGDCPWTAPWIVTAYGHRRLEQLRTQPMSCSGTTMAPVPLMMTYLRAMLDEIQVMRSGDAYLDQAAHNVLLHAGKVEPVRRMQNFEGPILTVGSEPACQLNAANELVNRDGSVIAIVHQYDRHPQLARTMEARVEPSGWRRGIAKIGIRLRNRLRSGSASSI